ncbi:MAG TPA: PilX N-terminal domain-containing pilus assembly protein, partial [Steroidobacteraceae bacterium]|nr:PilX N-terminal domain-containing pilus assembly protein [Steroidobacteraceae bacterium]
MITRQLRSMPRQRGMVLVTALLLLIVVTLLAVGMFRSFGLDEKIAGNVREKQRALNAAETAEEYAEFWLAAGNGTSP